jgi:hypothetical protein
MPDFDFVDAAALTSVCKAILALGSFFSSALTVKTVGCEILAVQQLSLSAIMTVSTELRVFCSYLVADLKSRDVLADLNNDAAGLVAGNDGHSRFEIAIVDVQICTANATGFH